MNTKNEDITQPRNDVNRLRNDVDHIMQEVWNIPKLKEEIQKSIEKDRTNNMRRALR